VQGYLFSRAFPASELNFKKVDVEAAVVETQSVIGSSQHFGEIVVQVA
jgi:hypothetical protein